MNLTLIVATRNRAQSLHRTLRAIEKIQSLSPWELVVVDNGSTDDTANVLSTFAEQTSLNMVVVHEPKLGIANARNSGMKAASGRILAFTDDDCLPARDFVDQTLLVFSEDASLGFVGGRILLHDDADQPIAIKESLDRELISPGQFIEVGLIHGANFAFRRTALQQAGGFDPFFGVGSYYAVEDIDLVSRVSASGWYGVYDARPLVYHDHGRKTLAEAHSTQNIYARGRGAYYVKCILARQWSFQAMKEWYWASRRKKLSSLSREFAGGVSFLFRSLWDRGQRFRNLDFQNIEKPC